MVVSQLNSAHNKSKQQRHFVAGRANARRCLRRYAPKHFWKNYRRRYFLEINPMNMRKILGKKHRGRDGEIRTHNLPLIWRYGV